MSITNIKKKTSYDTDLRHKNPYTALLSDGLLKLYIIEVCCSGVARYIIIHNTVTHSGPLGADLPLTADLELAGTGGFGPLQVSAAARVDIEGAVGVNLATQDLPMLHAQAAGLAAL